MSLSLALTLRFYDAMAGYSGIGHCFDTSAHAELRAYTFARPSLYYLFIFEPFLLVPTVGKVL